MDDSCIYTDETNYVERIQAMINQEEVQSDFFPGDERFPVESNEEISINYSPGMLAQIEDELNAERDRVFQEEFFFGCED
jgi:hypothetical protein